MSHVAQIRGFGIGTANDTPRQCRAIRQECKSVASLPGQDDPRAQGYGCRC